LFPESAEHLNRRGGPTFNALDNSASALFHSEDFVHSYTFPRYFALAYRHAFIQRQKTTLGASRPLVYGFELGGRYEKDLEPYLSGYASQDDKFNFEITTLPYHNYPAAPHTTLRYDGIFTDSLLRVQLTNLLNSPMDYVSYELPSKKSTTTAKWDATGSITLSSVLHYRGLSGGVEVSAPTELALSEAERKSSAPEVNFGASYRKDDIPYPVQLAWRTRVQGRLWTFSYRQQFTDNIAVAAKFESDTHRDRDWISGWGLSGFYQLSRDWLLRAQILPGKTAAASVFTSIVPFAVVRGSVGFPLDGRAEPHFGISATIGAESNSPF